MSHCVRLNGSGVQAVMNLRSQYTCTSLATNITGEPPVFYDTLPSLIWCLNDNEHSHDNLYHLVLNMNLKKERKRCMFTHTARAAAALKGHLVSFFHRSIKWPWSPLRGGGINNSYIVISEAWVREKNSVVVLIMRWGDALFTNPTYIAALDMNKIIYDKILLFLMPFLPLCVLHHPPTPPSL